MPCHNETREWFWFHIKCQLALHVHVNVFIETGTKGYTLNIKYQRNENFYPTCTLTVVQHCIDCSILFEWTSSQSIAENTVVCFHE